MLRVPIEIVVKIFEEAEITLRQLSSTADRYAIPSDAVSSDAISACPAYAVPADAEPVHPADCNDPSEPSYPASVTSSPSSADGCSHDIPSTGFAALLINTMINCIIEEFKA